MKKVVNKALKWILTWPYKALASVYPLSGVRLCCGHMLLSRNVRPLKKDLSPWNLLGRGYFLSMRNLLFVDTIWIRHMPDVVTLPVHARSLFVLLIIYLYDNNIA